jgi:hypothetical protein
MNDNAILEKEVDRGNKARSAYDNYLKEHFDNQKKALFDNFMKEKSLPVREVISTTLNAILSIERSIQTDIDTGKLAAKQLEDMNK